MGRKTKEELLEERTQRDWEKAHAQTVTPTIPPPVTVRPNSATLSTLYNTPAPAFPVSTPVANEPPKNTEPTIENVTPVPSVEETTPITENIKEEVSAPKEETPAATNKGNGLSVQVLPGGSLEGYVNGGVYNEETLNSYLEGLAAINKAGQTMFSEAPTYPGTYDAQLNAAYNKIVGREPFQYDIANDPMYQQFAEQYMRRGAMAAEDVAGQASAMTGGYGNSYAASVGNQAYQNYLQNINEMLPEFYGMALDRYNAQGDALEKEYSMLRDLADREYDIYQDELDNYWKGVQYEQNLADKAYERNQAARDEIITLMGYEYIPTDEELRAVGMTRAQADAYAAYFANGGDKPKTEDSPEMKIIKADLGQFTNNDDVYNYIVGLVENGMDEETANELYAEFYIPDELPMEKRKWEKGSVDGNFVDNYGSEYSADEIVDELKEQGWSEKEAQKYVYTIYDEVWGYDPKKFGK